MLLIFIQLLCHVRSKFSIAQRSFEFHFLSVEEPQHFPAAVTVLLTIKQNLSVTSLLRELCYANVITYY
jgi:hypothetical protein